MRAVKQAGERERLKPNLLLLTKGSDLIIVQEYLSREENSARQRLGDGPWFCGWVLKLDKSRQEKAMFYFCTAFYLSTGANYPGLGTFAVL